MKKTISKLKQGHWPVFLMSMLSAIVNLFLPTILVRILPPEEIGVYKIFFLYVQSITFLSLAGGPLYSVYYWVGKKEESNEYVDQAWKVCLGLSLTSTFIGLLFSFQISKMISLTWPQTLLLLLSAITTAPAAYLGEYLVAKGKRLYGSLFNSGFELLKGIAIVSATLIYRSIDAAFWTFSILFLIKLIIALVIGKKLKIISFQFDREKIVTVWKYCAPMSLAGVLGFFLEKIDMLLLSSRLSVEDFAYYSMGCLLVPPLVLLEMSVQKVLIPELSKAYHQLDLHSMILSYRKAQSDIAYLMIPSVFGLIVFARPIVEILFTKQYLTSAPFLQVFALTYLAYIFPHDAIPRATGNTKWVLKIYSIVTPITILSVGFMAGPYGAMGALATSTLFRFAPKIPGLLYAARVTKHSIPQLFAWRSLALYTFVNLILASVSISLKSQFTTEVKWFLILGPFYAVIYLVIVLFSKGLLDRKRAQ